MKQSYVVFYRFEGGILKPDGSRPAVENFATVDVDTINRETVESTIQSIIAGIHGALSKAQPVHGLAITGMFPIGEPFEPTPERIEAVH